MNLSPPFKIELAKEFKRLRRAPIVEAVIQWQATTTCPLEESVLLAKLKERFPTYESHRQHELEATLAESTDGLELRQQSQWHGFRLMSEDQKYICQFRPSGVVFSRLAPYEGWETFLREASPFLETFRDLASPSSLDNIGVRFVSQIELRDDQDVFHFVERIPNPLKKISLQSETFFHADNFSVGEYPYRLRLVRAVQPPQPPWTTWRTLIVDIDVTTIETTSFENLELRLKEMRYIKNAVFFSSMKNAEKLFG